MAEVTSGSNVHTVIVLNVKESNALARVLTGWVNDNLDKGPMVEDQSISDYRDLTELFESFDTVAQYI